MKRWVNIEVLEGTEVVLRKEVATDDNIPMSYKKALAMRLAEDTIGRAGTTRPVFHVRIGKAR